MVVLGATRVYERVKIDLWNAHERYIVPFSLYYCAMDYAVVSGSRVLKSTLSLSDK